VELGAEMAQRTAPMGGDAAAHQRSGGPTDGPLLGRTIGPCGIERGRGDQLGRWWVSAHSDKT
jgi:hypothetical protein